MDDNSNGKAVEIRELQRDMQELTSEIKELRTQLSKHATKLAVADAIYVKREDCVERHRQIDIQQTFWQGASKPILWLGMVVIAAAVGYIMQLIGG